MCDDNVGAMVTMTTMTVDSDDGGASMTVTVMTVTMCDDDRTVDDGRRYGWMTDDDDRYGVG